MNLIAHRGLTTNHLENTKEAILDALSSEAIDGVEFDIRMTKDKKMVVHHDDSLKRVFKKDKVISKLTLNELKKIEPRVPSLESILNSVKNYKYLLIEMKVKRDNYKIYVHEFYKIIDIYKHLNIIVTSFNKNALTYLSKLDKTLKPALLTYEIPLTLPLLFDLALNYKYLDSTIINRIVEEGKNIFLWVVNDPSHILDIKKEDNLFIITDDPLKFTKQE